MADVTLGEVSWGRMIRAVERVRERLLRAAATLEKAHVPYAVVGGNAVASWVSRVDESAVRNTRDVDLLIRRDDLPAAKAAMEAAGFVWRHVKGIDMFLDGPKAKTRDAIHLVFAREKVRPADPFPAPDVADAEPAANFQVIKLDALVHMKLTAYRDRDRMHLRDLLDVGLIDATWCPRLPAELAGRLQQILDTPEA